MTRIQLKFNETLPQSHKNPLVLRKQTVSIFSLKFKVLIMRLIYEKDTTL